MKPGAKYYDWELRGVPLRLELGPRDLEKQQGVLVRRDKKEKKPVSLSVLGEEAEELLERIQNDMLVAARDRREANSLRGPITYDRFREVMDGDGSFVYAGWCGSGACEAAIKEETKATIRVLPDEEFRSAEAPRTCLKCGQAARHCGRKRIDVDVRAWMAICLRGRVAVHDRARRGWSDVRVQRQRRRDFRPPARRPPGSLLRADHPAAEALLRLLRSLGSAADVVSGGELFRAQRAGFEPHDIIFGGVGKTEREIADGIDAGVLLLNIESEDELRTVDRLGRRAIIPAAIA
jgi:hypothetical protein